MLEGTDPNPSQMKLISLGEILWDIFDKDRRFLGGAPLNFAINAHRLGHSVILFSTVGNDALGLEARAQIAEAGLSTQFIGLNDEYATGNARVTCDPSGNTSFVISRPAAFDRPSSKLLALLCSSADKPDWIYFGTVAQTEARSEEALLQLVQSAPHASLFYDVNLRDGHWNLGLVERLSKIAHVIKLNISEANTLFGLTQETKPFSLEAFAAYWVIRFNVSVLCITLGEDGCAVYTQNELRFYDGLKVNVADTVGAGDAFAAGFLHGLHAGWPIDSIAYFANALGALIASRAGATPGWTLEECQRILASCTDRDSGRTNDAKQL